VADPLNLHLSTMAIAEAALAQMTSRSLPVDPRSYEVWYRFAAGDSGLLCAAVNGRLDRDGKLSPKDIEKIYSAHIAPTDGAVKAEKIGARIADEIDQIMAMIGLAEDSATNYAANLANVTKQLEAVKDREGARAIVESLVLVTREMESTNLKLQSQLQAMWDEVGHLRRHLEAVRKESLTDVLTTLGSRKFFDGALAKTVARCHADNAPLTLLLVDIDNFRTINETFGHSVGDRVMKFIAATLKNTLPGKDTAARFGGDEFAVIMPRTPLRNAVEVAEQLRLAVMKGELIRRSTGEKQTRLTISIGVAALHKGASPQALIEAADVCLYAAKRSGRNCVVGEQDDKLLTAMAGAPVPAPAPAVKAK
jgi:diguanylate cyclase